jgi:hypothetical protein
MAMLEVVMGSKGSNELAVQYTWGMAGCMKCIMDFKYA